jgi:hypothetical protein
MVRQDPFAVLEDRSVQGRARTTAVRDGILRSNEDRVEGGENQAHFERLLKRHGDDHKWAENLLARSREEYASAFSKLVTGREASLTPRSGPPSRSAPTPRVATSTPTHLDPTLLLTNSGRQQRHAAVRQDRDPHRGLDLERRHHRRRHRLLGRRARRGLRRLPGCGPRLDHRVQGAGLHPGVRRRLRRHRRPDPGRPRPVRGRQGPARGRRPHDRQSGTSAAQGPVHRPQRLLVAADHVDHRVRRSARSTSTPSTGRCPSAGAARVRSS